MEDTPAAAAHIELGAGLSMATFIGRIRRHVEDLSSTDSLLRALAGSQHFRRDTALGGLFHHRKISFREISPTDSLHIVFDRDRVSAHLDRISPLNVEPGKPAHYSWPRVLAHNLSAAADWVRRSVSH